MSDVYNGFDTDPYAGFDLPKQLPRAIGSVGSNGQQAGESLTLSKKTGVPAPVIDADLPGFKNDLSAKTASRVVQENPVVQAYLDANSLHANISNDDYENLDKFTTQAKESTNDGIISRLWNATSRGFEQGFGTESQFRKDFKRLYPNTFALWQPFTDTVELAFRLPGGIIGATAGAGAQTAREVGVSEAWANRLERDLNIIGQGVLIEPLMGTAGARAPKEGQATAKEVPKLRPESVEMLKRNETPPAGFDPILDEVHTQQAKLDLNNLDKLIAVRDQTTTHGRSVDAFEDFAIKATDNKYIQIPADAIADLYKTEKKVPSVDDGLLGWIPDLEAKVKAAQETGGDVDVSLGGYVARVDTSVHTKLQEFLRLREDGVSLAEVKEIKEAKPKPETVAKEGKEFQDTRGGTDKFHGTSVTDLTLDEGHYSSANYYGQGLYTTDAVDIAYGYSKRGAKDTGERNLFQVTEKGSAKLYDAEQPISPEIKQLLEKADPEHASGALESGAKNLREVFDDIRDQATGDGLSRDSIQEIFEGIQESLLNAGYRGMTHTGGLRTKAKPHSVSIYFRPEEDLTVKKLEFDMFKVAQTQQEAMHLNPVFKDAKAAKMNDVDFQRYTKKINERQDVLDERAINAASREIKRRQSTEWKANETEVRAEVENDIKYNPTLMADRYFRTGESPNEFVPKGLKLDDTYKRPGLPKEMFEKNGSNPDDVGPLFGFNSGEALLNNLDILEGARRGNKETPAEHLKRITEQEVEKRMEAKYGDLAENIRKEAEEAVLGHQQLDILADELRALAEQVGEEFPLTRDELTKMIKDKFDSTPVETLANSKKLQREVGRAGQKVESNLLKGDVPEAFKWGQRRLLSFGLAREAMRFEKEKARIDKFIDQITNDREIGSVEQSHVEQLRSMLNGIGYKGSQEVKTNLGSTAQFVADSNGQIAVAPWLIDPQLRTFVGPHDIPIGAYRALGKSIQSVLHAGREATKLENVHGKADLQNVVFDIKKELERFDLIEQPLNPSVPQRAKALMRRVNGWSLLVERMLDYTDKFNPNGPLTSYLDRPLRDANTKELKLTETTTRKLRALQKYTNNSIMDIIPNEVIPSGLNESGFLDLTRRNLRQLMGHMGSESGIKKVVEGFGPAVDEKSAMGNAARAQFTDKVWKLIHENATEADWKWVSGMHELFRDLWEESAKMQERDTGVVADPIGAVKMSSPKFGDFEGGYWPVKYDRKRSNIEGHIASKNPLFDEHYVNAATPQAYTLSRTGFSAPLDLSGQLLGSHIQGMVHDIAFREAIRNAGKLINNGEFMAAMTQKWSDEYAGLMHQWLKDVANSHNVDDSYAQGAARFSSIIRQNVVSTLIALNPGTYIKHGSTAAAMSVEKVGAKNFGSAAIDIGLKGIAGAAKDLINSPRVERPEPTFVDALKMVTDPSPKGEEVRQFILDSSPVMRNRQKNYQDTIRGAYESGLYSGPMQVAADARQMSMMIGRFPVALSDAVSAMPTWYAAYKDALTRTGDHADAVFEADRQVSRAHGSSAIMDKARVMRTGEAMRWITPLYNFWNHMQNNYMQLAWDMAAYAKGRDEPNANIQSLSNRMFWLVVLPIAIEEMASPALDENHESLGKRAFLATLRHFGAGYIGMRDVTNAVANGYEPSVGLIGTVMKSATNAARDIKNAAATGKTISKDWMTHAATALGMATGIGGTQYGKTGSFMKDLATGTEKPKGFNEYRQGFRTGHSKARIHK